MQFSRHSQMDEKSSAARGQNIRRAAAIALAASVFFPTTQTQAANSLLELFQQRRQQQVQPVQPQVAPRAPVAPNTASAPRAAVRSLPPVQRVTVKGPQIYDYKPYSLVNI